MSLLNQVLQDLDQRAPERARQTVRLAGVPAAVEDVDDFPQRAGTDWIRLVVWTLLSGFLVWAGWVYLAFPSVKRVAPVQPALLSPSVTPVAQTRPLDGAPAEPPLPAAALPVPATRAPVSSVPNDAWRDGVVAQGGGEGSHQASAKAVGPKSAYLPLRNTVMPPAGGPSSAARARTVAAAPVKVVAPSDTDPIADIRAALDAGELAHAEQLLQRRLRVAPRDGDARELLVGLLLRGDRLEAAMQQLDQGLRDDPAHPKFQLIKARLLILQGDMAAAVAMLEDMRQRRTAGNEALQMLGALYQRQARYEVAVEVYRELVTRVPGAGPAWVGLAISQDGRGDTAAAVAYRRALELGGLPAPAEAYARQRLSEMEQGNG